MGLPFTLDMTEEAISSFGESNALSSRNLLSCGKHKGIDTKKHIPLENHGVNF